MNIHEWAGEDIPTAVIEQTAEWIAVLDDIDAKADSEALRADFYSWLGENPVHQQAYVELSEIWAKTACIESFKSSIEMSRVLSFPSGPNIDFTNDASTTQPLLSDPFTCSNSASPPWLYALVLSSIAFGFILTVAF